MHDHDRRLWNMRAGIWRVVVMLCGVLIALSAAAAGPSFPALRALPDQGAAVTALAVGLPGGRPLAALDPHRTLTPASLTKLFTAAAALVAWGPDKTFTTRLLATGAPRHGVLAGDVILLGGGDPALTHGQLWSLALQLKSAGIHRIKGHLVINQSLFGPVACVTSDRCQAHQHSDSVYDAPLSAAGVDFATWCVRVSPGTRVGALAVVRPCAFSLPGVVVQARVRTVAQGNPSSLEADRTTVQGRDQLMLSGRIALDSAPQRIYLSASRAAWQSGLIMRRLLRLAGITVQGSTRVTSSTPPVGARELASVDSRPLRQQLASMMAYSNNYMADTLALDLLARDPAVPRPLTLAQAGAVVQALAGPLVADPPGQPDSGRPNLLSGSGLTIHNALSAADIVALLAGMYRRSDLFPAYLGVLSVPRYAMLHILRGGNADWSTRLAAKTGLLNDPVSVLGVAGYFRRRDGGWGAFAILVNGTSRRPHIPYDQILQAIHHDVGQLLARY